jgi:TolA protein
MSNTTKSYLPFSILIFTMSMFVITGCGNEETTEEATPEQEITNQITIQQESEQNLTAELEEEKMKEEAKMKAETDAKAKAKADAKRKADAKAKADAKRKADADAKKKAEADAKKKAETGLNEKAKREMEEKMRAIEEANKKAEAEAKKKAIEEAKKKAENLPKPNNSPAATSSVAGLDGRTLKSKPEQSNDIGVPGSIIINICINQKGDVSEVNYVPKGSTITDNAFIKQVVANTRRWKFIESATATDKECGAVTYLFK